MGCLSWNCVCICVWWLILVHSIDVLDHRRRVLFDFNTIFPRVQAASQWNFIVLDKVERSEKYSRLASLLDFFSLARFTRVRCPCNQPNTPVTFFLISFSLFLSLSLAFFFFFFLVHDSTMSIRYLDSIARCWTSEVIYWLTSRGRWKTNRVFTSILSIFLFSTLQIHPSIDALQSLFPLTFDNLVSERKSNWDLVKRETRR